VSFREVYKAHITWCLSGLFESIADATSCDPGRKTRRLVLFPFADPTFQPPRNKADVWFPQIFEKQTRCCLNKQNPGSFFLLFAKNHDM